MSSSRNSGGSRGNSRGDFPITITARDVGIDQSITKLTRFVDVIKTLDAQMKTAMTSMTAYQNMFMNFGRNFTTLNTGFNQGAQGANTFNQALQNNVNTLRSGQTTLTSYMNTQKQTTQAAQQASTAQTTLNANTTRLNQTFTQTRATLGQAVGSLQTYDRTLQQSAQSTQQAANSQTLLSQKVQQNSTMMRNATANTRMYSSGNAAAAGSSDQLTTSLNQQRAGFSGAMEQAVPYISRMMGMALILGMADQAIHENIGMQEMLAVSKKKIIQLQEEENAMIQQYGEDSYKAELATRRREKAEAGLMYTQRNAAYTQRDLSYFTLLIATQVIGTVIPAISKWKETKEALTKAVTIFSGVMSALPSKLHGLTTAMGLTSAAAAVNNTVLTSAGAAATKTTVQVGALSTAQMTNAGITGVMAAAHKIATAVMAAKTAVTTALTAALARLRIAMVANMAVLGPIGLALAAVGLALAAIATDFMGVRTHLEGFGAEVGRQIPILFPFLEGIQGVGAALGLTGESAEEAQGHFENATRGFENMSTLWNDTVANMQDSSNRLVSSVGDMAAVLGRDLSMASEKLDGQLKATVDTWHEFVDALGSGDYEKATDIIISTFEALPGIIGTALSTLGTIVYNAFAGLVEVVGPALIGIGSVLASRLLNGINQGWSDLTNWINTNFVTPVKNEIMNLPSKITGIAEDIVKKLLTGEYAAEIQTWASEVWASLNKAWHDFIHGEGGDQIKEPAQSFVGTGQSSGLTPVEDESGNITWQAPPSTSEVATGINNAIKDSGGVMKTPADTTISEPMGPVKSPSEPVPAPTPTIITPTNTGNVAPNPYQLTPPTSDPKILPIMGGTPKATHSGQNPYEVGRESTAAAAAPVELTPAEQQTKALDDLAASYEDVESSQKDAALSGIAFLRQQEQIHPELLRNDSALRSIAQSVGPVVEGNAAMTTTLHDNAVALENNYLQGVLFEKGQLEQRKVLQDMQMQVETNKGTLSEYAAQVEEGTIKSYAFTLGQQEQRKSLLDAQVEIASTNGMIQEYALQLEDGEIQQVAFSQGQQEMVKHFMDVIVETENLNGQFTVLQWAMESADVAQTMFSNGLAKGRVETAMQIVSMDQLRGEYAGTREVLIEQAQAMDINVAATNLSNEALANWIAVAKGVPEAVQAMIDSFTEFADSAIDTVAEALKQGGEDLDEAFDKIEEALGDNLTGDEKLIIEVQAETQNAVEQVKSSFSLAFQWVMNQDIIVGQGGVDMSELENAVTERLGETMEKVEDQFNDSGSIVKTGWGNILMELKDLNNPENIMNAQAWISSASNIAANFATMGKSAGEAAAFMNELGVPADVAATALEKAGYSMGELGKNAAAADPELQKMIASIERMNTIDAAATQIFTVNIPSYVVTMAAEVIAGFLAAEVGAIQTMNTIDATATQIFVTNIPSYPVNVSNAVAEHFGKAADDGINLMNALDSGVSQSFDNMAGYTSLVSQAVDSEFGKAADDGTSLIQALERAVEQSASAMADSLGQVADAIGAIETSANDAESAVENLRTSVESLPNVERTITYRIETVGRRPAGAQFGTNMLVDKPQMLLVGEGWGKERVKVSPGTMPFMEDFSTEMNQKFEAQRAAQNTQNQQQQTTNPNVYAPGYQHTNTNQNNNPDLGNGSSGMMISNNASLVQMNNANGKRMIVDGKTGTVIMMDGSSNSGSGSGSGNTNTNTGSSSGGTNKQYTDENGNNFNNQSDSNSQNNVYAPGYNHNDNTVPGSSNGSRSSPSSGAGAAAGSNNNGISQNQSVNQSGSGQNLYYQSQTNNGQTSVNTNMGQNASIPIPPGMINQSAASSGNTPVSGSFSNDSRSRLLARGDPFGFQHRVIQETPVEVNVNVDGVKLARALLKILNEQLGYGSGYYG